MRKIIRNRLQCGKCQDIIESVHVHDFVTCKCGAISADGGKEYLRRLGDIKGYIELSEYEEVDDDYHDHH